MSAPVRSRGRIARVRKLQHGLAAVRAFQAATEAEQLKLSQERLAMLRTELQVDPGLTDGGALSRRGELAMRLDAAHQGMVPAIIRARSRAEAEEGARIEARIKQESATKLHHTARRAADAAAEYRMARAWRGKTPSKQDEV